MKILINTPRLIPQGGVANHYLGLRPYWNENVKYNVVGKRNGHVGSGKYWLVYDIFKFILKIIIFRPDIILLNPSLASGALKRDDIFLKIATIFHKKVTVFFHGFDFEYSKQIYAENFARKFNKASSFIVLSHAIRNTLINLGINRHIYLSTTKVEDSLIKDFNINSRKGQINSILFLARITEAKGIFIALDAFRIIQKEYPHLSLHVVGDGSALNNAKNYCSENNINNVIFLGSLSGNKLISEFSNADLYLFPTYHAEGMPTSVLEAMAFGLPVITRPVGGLVDFFENGKMGMMVDSLKAEDFATEIEKLITKPQTLKEISIYNHNYAIKHFLASNVARNIETILKTTINQQKIK